MEPATGAAPAAEPAHAHGSIPTAALADLLEEPGLEGYDLTALRRLTSGGAPMPPALAARVRAVLGVDFIEAYGLTETAATTHLNPIWRPRPGSVGQPFFGTTAIVADPQSLKPVRDGETGEILVSGPQLFESYWGRPRETQEAFAIVGGVRFLRTGDIGHRDADGYFYMTDRAKRMMNAAGCKVWPAEVEGVLQGHPGVRDVCVVGCRAPHRGETVKAIVVAKPGVPLQAESLVAWARERMAAYKYPRVVEFVDSLPRSAAGKVLWRQLHDAENARSASPEVAR